MFSFFKKSFLRIVITLCAIILLLVISMFLLILDPKDRCLDYGGRYDEVNKTCEK